MVTTAHQLHYDYEQYLTALATSTLKLEFREGVIYAMAGGTPAHAQLAAAMIVALASQLPRECRVATSDLKVRVEAADLSAFPDASVVCGDTQSSPLDANAIVNPSLLVEVTSKSTEDYDRGDKLAHYKLLDALRVVLIVSHRERRITAVQRGPDGAWSTSDARGGQRLELLLHGASLSVDAVYDGIALDPV